MENMIEESNVTFDEELTLDKKIEQIEKIGSNKYFDIPEKLNIHLKGAYNDSQYNAIRSCLKKEGITLIQGPPGTGKTHTILGVLSVLLNSTNRRK